MTRRKRCTQERRSEKGKKLNKKGKKKRGAKKELFVGSYVNGMGHLRHLSIYLSIPKRPVFSLLGVLTP